MTVADGNAFLDFIGANLVEWREGYSEFHLPIRSVLLNRQGVLQGGVLSTLLDVACGYTGLFSPDLQIRRHSSTVSLNINFLSKGINGTVVAKGILARRGRSLYFSHAEAWIDNKTLLATAQGCFKWGENRS